VGADFFILGKIFDSQETRKNHSRHIVDRAFPSALPRNGFI